MGNIGLYFVFLAISSVSGVMNVCVCSCMHPRSCIWRLEEDLGALHSHRLPSPLREALPSSWLGWWPASPSDPFVSTYPPALHLQAHAPCPTLCTGAGLWTQDLRLPSKRHPLLSGLQVLVILPLVFVRVILVYFCRNLCRINCSFLCRLWWVIWVIILSPLVAVSLPGLSFRYIVAVMIP